MNSRPCQTSKRVVWDIFSMNQNHQGAFQRRLSEKSEKAQIWSFFNEQIDSSNMWEKSKKLFILPKLNGWLQEVNRAHFLFWEHNFYIHATPYLIPNAKHLREWFETAFQWTKTIRGPSKGVWVQIRKRPRFGRFSMSKLTFQNSGNNFFNQL